MQGLNTLQLLKEIQADLQQHGNAVARRAQQNHPTWKRQSGNLDRSHTADVEGLNLHVYLDPSAGIEDEKSGYNYGIAQHSGTIRGIAGDPWLFRAQEEQDRDTPIAGVIADTIMKAMREALR
jgi:hypothetical protein